MLTSHKGEKLVDESNGFWEDHEEDHHGFREDLHDEPEFAEGFVWSCCNRLGDGPGCQSSQHEPEEGPEERRRKRVRIQKVA